MGPLESAAMEAVAAVEAEAAAAESSQAENGNNNSNNKNISKKEEVTIHNHSHAPYKSSSVSQRLALVPLRPASKKKTLEVKQLPIVLGRTNLAQWWYQSCDCQHYYCRLHCRPVAQNIGSLSKVMIQIDSTGKVFVVGKNPHLVTITPERKDQILRVNDILSIGRRDREPWMRFQVVMTNGHSTIAPSPSIKNASSRSRNNNSASAASGEEPVKKKQKVLFTGSPSAAAAAAAATTAKSKDAQRSSSNMSSAVSGNDNKKERPVVPQQQAAAAQKQVVPSPVPKSTAPKQPTQQQMQPSAAQNNNSNTDKPASGPQHDCQLPEWITTTHAKRNRGNRSTSSLSMAPQGTNSKQQQHQAIVARLTKAATAANADAVANSATMAPQAAPAAAAYAKKHHQESEANMAQQQQRKRRRRTARDINNNTSSSLGNPGGPSRGIRSAEDLFNGSRPHYPQIHLVFQDYETSARLVKATQRDVAVDMTRRQPRNTRIFISKPGEGPPPRNGRMSPRTTESGGEEGPEQMGILSKNFAAALLGAAAPAPASNDAQNNDNDPPVVMQEDGGVVVQVRTNGPAKESVSQQERSAGKAADEKEDRNRPHGMPRSDSATCRAALAKYTAEKQAAKRREGTTQAEGEITSEAAHAKNAQKDQSGSDDQVNG
ncbi:MAG: hypothetical protein SGILL_000667 [Bacillariaceae sp.]